MKTMHFVLNPDNNVTLDANLFEKSPEMPSCDKRPAVVVCPGGGYGICSDREADPVAMIFAAAGYQTFVLRYSLREKAVFPQPVVDLSIAIKFIRENAEEFGVIQDQIATIGFSAGGHLCATQSSLWNDPEIMRLSGCLNGENKPNAVMLGYPVISSSWVETWSDLSALLNGVTEEKYRRFNAQNNVGPHNPPTFLFHTFRDGAVPVEDSLVFAEALAKNNVPFEMHVFPNGWHGMSVADHNVNAEDASLHQWTSLAVSWLDRIFRNPEEAFAPVNRAVFKTTPPEFKE